MTCLSIPFEQVILLNSVGMERATEAVESMYLSTIPNRKHQTAFIRSPLDVSDIQGAKSRYLEHPRPERESALRMHDIERSQPRQLIPTVVNKPSFVLEVNDIEGTRTRVNKFSTTRQTNPLDPHYQSSKVEFVPVEEPKFIRDTLEIDDIEGVRKKETFANRIERAGKTINTKAEITVGIKPKPKGFARMRTCNDFWNVKDINTGQNFYGGNPKRQTNPLEPRYNITEQKGYGEIPGSKLAVKNNGLPLRQSNSLITADIQGARPKHNNFVVEHKEEVIGSKPQSLKRGISGTRRTNPLQPKYNYPGESEVRATTSTFTRPKTAVQRMDAFIK